MLLERANFQDALLQRESHFLMHGRRVIAFDEIRPVPVSDQQRFQFFVGNASKNGWIRDLLAVKVKHGKDSPIANGI